MIGLCGLHIFFYSICTKVTGIFAVVQGSECEIRADCMYLLLHLISIQETGELGPCELHIIIA